tara:strand:+ start:2279 stop:2986 length:708 start_codon:yes stop_codon:yes gene_type:complete
MENYLYFRKNRPISASVTLGSATQTCPAFSASDIGTLGGNDNENEIAAISILSHDGGGTGHAQVLFEPSAIVPTLTYTGSALAIATGTTHWIEPADQSYENGVLVLDDHSTTGGYTLDTGDIVTAYWKTGLETACMYPVSALKGIVAASDTVTVLHFASILGDATDDTITFTHASLGFEKVCKIINDACNAYPRDGRLIKVYDGHDGVISSLNGNPAAITMMEYAPEGGAVGMAT